MPRLYVRLSLADRSFLRLEYPGGPEHVAAICRVDPRPLLDKTGELDMAMIRRRLERRLERVPELRRIVHHPPPLGGPALWVDDPAFAIDRHIRTAVVAPPGDEGSILTTAEQILGSLLDRSHPLWELWFLTGVEGGRIAMLLKIHHAIADGLAAVALIASLLDLEPDALDPSAAEWRPAPAPAGGRLVLDNLRFRMTSLTSFIARPVTHMRSVVADLVEWKRMFSLSTAAPKSSLNVLVGSKRRAHVLHLDLETARTVAHTHRAKVNDLILAVVAGGVRELLIARGELTERLELVAAVPATLRSAKAARDLGNGAGGIAIRLPVGVADSTRRLDLIAASARIAKAEQKPASVQALMDWLGAAGLSRWFVERQRMINLIVTNVPGPPQPLYVLGARIEDVTPIVGTAGNVTLVFAALSYCGRLNLVVNADATACPDIDVLVAGMDRTWAELTGATMPLGAIG